MITKKHISVVLPFQHRLTDASTATALCPQCNRGFHLPLRKKIRYKNKCAHQMSLFCEPAYNCDLDISDKCGCPHCRFEGFIIKDDYGSTSIRFDIYAGERNITVTQHIDFIDSYIMYRRRAQDLEHYEIPKQIDLIFDADTGRTYVKAGDNKEYDITEQPEPMRWNILYLTNKRPELYKPLISLFEEMYGSPLPISLEEDRLAKLILLNRFQFFPGHFYHSLPLVTGSRSRVIHSSFKDIAERLYRYSNVPVLYNQLQLPDKKALKKIIIANPQLLFYHTEIKGLMFFNYDILLRMLQSPNIYRFLSFIRVMPQILIYVEQMNSEYGSGFIWKEINKNFFPFISDAYDYWRILHFASFLRQKGETYKLTVKQWREYPRINKALPVISFNVPLIFNSSIPDTVIDGYRVVKLLTSQDYSDASTDLTNCLENLWAQQIDSGNAIFCIKDKDGRYIAAIELDSNGKRVIQAKIEYNRDISGNRIVHTVYMKWLKRYKITGHQHSSNQV